ncbi:MAG: Rieske (2Fe-2S) protein [Gemmatimonadota bacterium]|nr:MAG: Rieske (2Fe-2S) protein [Gemmatimonadota bacterium]
MSDHEEKATRTSRRYFLASGFVAVGGILLTGLFVLRSGFLFLFPKSREREYTKYLVGKAKDIPVGKAKEISIGNKPVFVTHLPEGFRVFSGVCPHLGCIVKWKERENQFYCPCHKAVFDNDGTVLAGPSPRPLDEFEVLVEGSLVFVHIRKREPVI